MKKKVFFTTSTSGIGALSTGVWQLRTAKSAFTEALLLLYTTPNVGHIYREGT